MLRSITVAELRKVLSEVSGDSQVFVWPRPNDDPFPGDPHIYLIYDPDLGEEDKIQRVEKGDGTVLYKGDTNGI